MLQAGTALEKAFPEGLLLHLSAPALGGVQGMLWGSEAQMRTLARTGPGLHQGANNVLATGTAHWVRSPSAPGTLLLRRRRTQCGT